MLIFPESLTVLAFGDRSQGSLGPAFQCSGLRFLHLQNRDGYSARGRRRAAQKWGAPAGTLKCARSGRARRRRRGDSDHRLVMGRRQLGAGCGLSCGHPLRVGRGWTGRLPRRGLDRECRVGRLGWPLGNIRVVGARITE